MAFLIFCLFPAVHCSRPKLGGSHSQSRTLNRGHKTVIERSWRFLGVPVGHFGVLELLPYILVVLRDSCGGTCLLRSSTDLRGVILRSFWVKGVPTAFWWSILVLATFHLLPFDNIIVSPSLEG